MHVHALSSQHVNAVLYELVCHAVIEVFESVLAVYILGPNALEN